MNFVVLTIGLILERFASHWLRWHELRWLDWYCDWAIAKLNRYTGMLGITMAAGLILLPAIPVVAISTTLLVERAWSGWAYWGFSILVLFISLGPRDLREAAEELADANDRGDLEAAKRISKEITEVDPPESPTLRCRAIVEAIFIQANNRVFAIVFWFVLLGPAGAFVFRIADVIRRRAMFESVRAESLQMENALRAIFSVHGALAWLPARALALGYAMAGSFEDAVSDYRQYSQDTAEHFFEVSADVVAVSGCGALGSAMENDAESGGEVCLVESNTVRAAMRLVNRTLLVWMTAIAVLTIMGLWG